MTLDAGKLDRRAAFHRRAVLAAAVAGNQRGGFEAVPFLTVWANFRQTPGREQVSAGLVEDQIGGTLRIRDCRAAREITAADRVVMSGANFAIRSVGLPEVLQGYIEFVVQREVAG